MNGRQAGQGNLEGERERVREKGIQAEDVQRLDEPHRFVWSVRCDYGF